MSVMDSGPPASVALCGATAWACCTPSTKVDMGNAETLLVDRACTSEPSLQSPASPRLAAAPPASSATAAAARAAAAHPRT